MGKRNLYLNNTPVEEAKALYQKALGSTVQPQGRMDSRDGKSAPDYKRGSLCEILCLRFTMRRRWMESRLISERTKVSGGPEVACP